MCCFLQLVDVLHLKIFFKDILRSEDWLNLDILQQLQVKFFPISQQSKECPRERKIIDIS